MAGWLTLEQLTCMGVRLYGKNIKVSNLARLYNPSNIILHDNIRIDDFTILSANEPIEIFNYIHIGPWCLLSSAKGIVIKDFSAVSSACRLYGATDNYDGSAITNPTAPKNMRSVISGKIVLENHSIIGTNSTLMPGVHLDVGTAVGANSLVTKNTDPWSIYVGTPAKKIKARKNDCVKFEEMLKDTLK
jgi:acetyltransferase-like isoleucine patch superfamily enzyme